MLSASIPGDIDPQQVDASNRDGIVLSSSIIFFKHQEETHLILLNPAVVPKLRVALKSRFIFCVLSGVPLVIIISLVTKGPAVVDSKRVVAIFGHPKRVISFGPHPPHGEGGSQGGGSGAWAWER